MAEKQLKKHYTTYFILKRFTKKRNFVQIYFIFVPSANVSCQLFKKRLLNSQILLLLLFISNIILEILICRFLGLSRFEKKDNRIKLFANYWCKIVLNYSFSSIPNIRLKWVKIAHFMSLETCKVSFVIRLKMDKLFNWTCFYAETLCKHLTHFPFNKIHNTFK